MTTSDIHARIDQAVADKGATHHDAQVLHDFADFLQNPGTRCPICLANDHTRPSQCSEVSDIERRRYGVMQMDAAYAQQMSRTAL